MSRRFIPYGCFAFPTLVFGPSLPYGVLLMTIVNRPGRDAPLSGLAQVGDRFSEPVGMKRFQRFVDVLDVGLASYRFE